MHRATKLSATVMMGLALAAAPAWVNAADEKKSTTQSVKTTVSDSWITSKTKIALFADSRVPGTSVNVETTKGTVFLRGKVDNAAAKAAAEEITKGIEGVTAVKNELQWWTQCKRWEGRTTISPRGEARLPTTPPQEGGCAGANGVVTFRRGGTSPTARASQLARGVPGVRAVKNDVTFDSAMDDSSTMKNRLTRAKDNIVDKKNTMMDGSDKTTGSQTHVAAAQQALKTNGYNPGPIDGYAGPQTTTAGCFRASSGQLQVTGTGPRVGRLAVGLGGAARSPTRKRNCRGVGRPENLPGPFSYDEEDGLGMRAGVLAVWGGYRGVCVPARAMDPTAAQGRRDLGRAGGGGANGRGDSSRRPARRGLQVTGPSTAYGGGRETEREEDHEGREGSGQQGREVLHN